MKILTTLITILFISLLSSPLYSNEFTYHCDRTDNNLSMVFDVNRSEKSIVHTHSIDKTTNSVSKKSLPIEIYNWDERKDSVWTIYSDPQSLSFVTFLFNFQHQKLVLQSIFNIFLTEEDDLDDIVISSLFKCYIIQ